MSIKSHQNQIALALHLLEVGTKAVIAGMQGVNATSLRLQEMGLCEGSLIKIERIAPFGGPIQLRIKNSSLCIRREDAQMIMVYET